MAEGAADLLWRQVGDDDELLADERCWIVVEFADAADDGAFFAANVEGELQELVGFFDWLAVFDNGDAQIELAEIYQALAKQSDSVPRQPKYKPVFRVSSKARKKYFPAEYDEHDIESVIQDLLESWAREHNPDFTKE